MNNVIIPLNVAIPHLEYCIDAYRQYLILVIIHRL